MSCWSLQDLGTVQLPARLLWRRLLTWALACASLKLSQISRWKSQQQDLHELQVRPCVMAILH